MFQNLVVLYAFQTKAGYLEDFERMGLQHSSYANNDFTLYVGHVGVKIAFANEEKRGKTKKITLVFLSMPGFPGSRKTRVKSNRKKGGGSDGT